MNSLPSSIEDLISVLLIKRVQPSLIAGELVKVQPLSGPSGMVFHMNTGKPEPEPEPEPEPQYPSIEDLISVLEVSSLKTRGRLEVE